MKRIKHKKLLIVSMAVLLLPFSIRFISYPWCSRKSADFFEVNKATYQRMDKGIDYWLNKDMERSSFQTGSSRFDGEWLFGTYFMSAVGLCQESLTFPELKKKNLPKIEFALNKIRSEQLQEFDREAWGTKPLSLDGHDHAAFLGYYNLALSLFHFLKKDDFDKGENELIKLNHRITSYLAKRMNLSSLKMLQSYPQEVYPVDNCAVIASIGLYDKAMSKKPRALILEWLARCRDLCLDKETGTLIQRLYWEDGSMLEYPRASGTFLGIYFLSFVDIDFAEELYRNGRKEFFTSICGFGGVREYTGNYEGGFGDIDSGPVICGFGVSPTGFMMGCARIFGDEVTFSRLFATCYLAGAPVSDKGRWNWSIAGPVGDSILFGMLSSIKADRWRAGFEKNN